MTWRFTDTTHHEDTYKDRRGYGGPGLSSTARPDLRCVGRTDAISAPQALHFGAVSDRARQWEDSFWKLVFSSSKFEHIHTHTRRIKLVSTATGILFLMTG